MKKIALFATPCFLLLAIAVFAFYSGAVFQRGNPLPYLSKMIALRETNRFAKVFADEEIYLSRTGDYDALIKYIESAHDVTFAERMGSAFFFHSDDKSLIASTEIYWRNYLVWEIATQGNRIDSLMHFDTYALNGFTIRYPKKWEKADLETDDGHGIQFWDSGVEAVRWHDLDIYTHIQIRVADEGQLSYQSAQEHMEIVYNDLSQHVEKEKALLIIDGVEISKVSHNRPYFSYRLIEMYFQYNDKEYFVGIHFDNDNDEIVGFVAAFLESFAFDRDRV